MRPQLTPALFSQRAPNAKPFVQSRSFICVATEMRACSLVMLVFGVFDPVLLLVLKNTTFLTFLRTQGQGSPTHIRSGACHCIFNALLLYGRVDYCLR